MGIDTIIRNARIVTVDDVRPEARSIGIDGTRIVGFDEDLDGVRADRVVDLGGAVLLPGFNDVHAHSVKYGQSLREIDLSDVTDGARLLERIGAHARSGTGWLIASGLNPLGVSGPLPSRDELDRASSGRPLWIKHASSHAYTLNGAALAKIGVPQYPSVQPSGGVIVVDASGRATGLLEENAMHLVHEALLPDSLEDIDQALDLATARYVREGLTSVTDAGTSGGWIGHSPRELAAYQRARERGALRVRMQAMVASEALHRLEGHASDPTARGFGAGIRSGFGDEWLQIGPTKAFLDGSLLGATAALSEEYDNCAGSRGYLAGDADAMSTQLLEAAAGGWSLALHAIGDAGVDLALEIIGTALARHGRPVLPHRIEHGGVVRPDQILRIVELGVVVVPQPYFIGVFGDGMLANLGPRRAEWSYRAQTILDAGGIVPGSSDRPVAPGAPLRVVQAFVERLTETGAPYGPGERLSAEEAIRAYTLGSARATGWAHAKGSLSRGKLADLVVLAEDPREVDAASIGRIDVLGTVIGGRSAHGLPELADAGR
ncbi:amidohydrolase [Leucobacter weissii]|uniref:Amidohydrolase n=1 Tax=Leucobacter weissii TaxID=1983706 RepID=A0A939S6V1_9MICO|nr:amidohydrolase [Leucobacter weissii]MBO1902769.1 amidohydrolase [Leucobacter weissii]